MNAYGQSENKSRVDNNKNGAERQKKKEKESTTVQPVNN